METKEKNQINQQIIERAAFAATVAEAVVGNIGMRIVKHELDRLPIEELVAVWAGVHRLLGGERWEEALRMPRHVRQTAWFLAALIKPHAMAQSRGTEKTNDRDQSEARPKPSKA